MPLPAERFGIYATFGTRMPFRDRLKLIREAGFGATGIWWEELRADIRAIRDQAPDLIRRHDLYLDNFHVPYYACADLWADADQRREDAVALHRSWIDDCAWHEVPNLVMHVCLGPATPPPSKHGLDSFRRLIDHAQSVGVTIAIENTRDTGYIRFLLDAISSPALALCFDTSHAHLYDDEPAQLLADYQSRLVTTHLSDTDGRLDRHWLPGAGVVDFDAVACAMPREYRGVYMLECVPADREQDPVAFIVEARDALENTVSALTEPASRTTV